MNNNIKDITWGKFRIEDVFEVTGTKTTKLDDLKAYSEKEKYPYVTTKATTNAVDGFYNTWTEKGNVITFDSATIGFLSYQPYNFTASDHVEVLKPIDFKLNKEIAHFIISCINVSLSDKFNYGFKLSQTRMKKQVFYLPIKENGNINLEFMENYIKNKIVTKNKMYENAYVKRYADLKYNKVPKLTDKRWKEFLIIDLFECIQRGKRLTKKNQKNGNIPYISSTSQMNGINNFISNNVNVRIFENCLTLANSGSVGSTFYHQYSYVASDHVTHLKNTEYSKYTYLFIATQLNKLSEKYNFNREINDKRISRERILLPVDENGKLDVNYMDQYMINLIINNCKLNNEFMSDI